MGDDRVEECGDRVVGALRYRMPHAFNFELFRIRLRPTGLLDDSIADDHDPIAGRDPDRFGLVMKPFLDADGQSNAAIQPLEAAVGSVEHRISMPGIYVVESSRLYIEDADPNG